MKNDRGFVFVLTLCLSIMALAGVQSSIIETKLVGNDLMKAQAFQSRVGERKTSRVVLYEVVRHRWIIDVGGDLTILYCSEVEKFVENAIPLTKVISWQHKF